MLNRLLRLAAFQNPEFNKAQSMRLPTFNKPRLIACGEDLANYIALPRGCIADVAQLLETHKINIVIRDERFAGHAINVEFTGQLRPTQQDAAVMIAEHDQGILCAPTAFGKTALAAWMIAARKVNTLVLVHRQQLLDQWHARLAMFLNIPAKSIGNGLAIGFAGGEEKIGIVGKKRGRGAKLHKCGVALSGIPQRCAEPALCQLVRGIAVDDCAELGHGLCGPHQLHLVDSQPEIDSAHTGTKARGCGERPRRVGAPWLLRWDLIRTNFLDRELPPTFFYYNPFSTGKSISIEADGRVRDLAHRLIRVASD
jgi:hypothetical protein